MKSLRFDLLRLNMSRNTIVFLKNLLSFLHVIQVLYNLVANITAPLLLICLSLSRTSGKSSPEERKI
jgi:hypothetical protein